MTQQSSGPDPIGDFQRWLMRSGARGMSRDLGGQLAGLFGLGGKPGDVWENATAPAPTEAPECAWCPVCRAARLLRESGPGLASHMAAASDALASAVREASTVVESVLSAAGRRAGPPASGTGREWSAATGTGGEAATGTGWPSEPGSSEWDVAAHEKSTGASADGNGRGPDGAGGGESATPGEPPSSPE